MMTFDSPHGVPLGDADVALVPDGGDVAADHGCVVCAAVMEQTGCCSFDCVREARRELDDNVARLRGLQMHDGPADTRARLTARNGQLTAALMGWRQ